MKSLRPTSLEEDEVEVCAVEVGEELLEVVAGELEGDRAEEGQGAEAEGHLDNSKGAGEVK